MLNNAAEMVEVAALSLAVGGHAATYAARASKSASQRAEAHRTISTDSPALEHLNRASSVSGSALWLTAPLLVAAVTRHISSGIAR